MLRKRYSDEQLATYQDKNKAVQEAAQAYNQAMIRGEIEPIYRFGFNVLGGEELDITDKKIQLPGYQMPVDLNVENEFDDLV